MSNNDEFRAYMKRVQPITSDNLEPLVMALKFKIEELDARVATLERRNENGYELYQ